MTHQLPTGKSVQYGPRSLLQRQDLAALLGTVAAEWAALEREVTSVYAHLMGKYLPRIPGSSVPLHPVALQVFDTLETQRLRSDLLRKLAEWVLRDEENLIATLRDSVIPLIDKAAKLRNTMLHGHWGISAEYPDALILIPVFGHQLVYKQRDFDDAIDRILAATNALRGFDAQARAVLDRPQQ
jgi:hypothetical protein